MTEANKDDPPKPLPLPNGVVPHPQDFVVRIDGMNTNGVGTIGFIRVRAADGNIEVMGFDTTDDAAWGQIAEKINPAIVKLCRNFFASERKIAHMRREILNSHECLSRANEVALGKRPVML